MRVVRVEPANENTCGAALGNWFFRLDFWVCVCVRINIELMDCTLIITALSN